VRIVTLQNSGRIYASQVYVALGDASRIEDVNTHQEGVLFAGDTQLLITPPEGSYEGGFMAALDRLFASDIRRIYFGHGAPLTERCNERLRESQRMAAGRWNSVRPERINRLAPAKA
jgi:glyoxylase-like metal-dependent hydrolase (beta-lactamase superfamily II)